MHQASAVRRKARMWEHAGAEREDRPQGAGAWGEREGGAGGGAADWKESSKSKASSSGAMGSAMQREQREAGSKGITP